MTMTMFPKIVRVAPIVTAETFEQNGLTFENRTCHYRPECSKIEQSKIVAYDVRDDTRAAGFPCEWCNGVAEPVVRAETAARREHGNGEGGGRRAAPAAKTNRYGGKCRNCSTWIDAEAGLLVGSPGAWAVEHKAGECVERVAVAPVVREARVEAPEGMHRTENGDVFKAQRGRDSGNVYAKRLVLVERVNGAGEQIFDADGKPVMDGEFVFERGAILKLSAETLMSMDEAKAYGALYGVCCVCGATLEDEDSIRRGIGPVCGPRMAEQEFKVTLTTAQWKAYDDVRAGKAITAGMRGKLVAKGLVI